METDLFLRDHSIFSLFIPQHDLYLPIYSFSGRDHLALGYRFCIQTDPHIHSLISSHVRFCIGGTTYFHGVITQVQPGKIILDDPLAPLKFTKHSRVLRDVTINDFIRELILSLNSEFIRFKILLNSELTTLKITMLCQYQESDYDFLKRICHTFGILINFQQTEEQVEILFSDNATCFDIEPRKLTYIFNSSMSIDTPHIFYLRNQLRVQNETCTFSNYNHEINSAWHCETLKNQSSIPGFGNRHQHVDTTYSAATLSLLNKLKMANIEYQRFSLTAKTTALGLQSGDVIHIDFDGDENFADTEYFRIVSIKHYGDQNQTKLSAPHQRRYYNQLKLIPAHLKYVPTVKTKRRVGFLPARIESTMNTPELDHLGRYRIRYSFDTVNAKANASYPLRLLTPLTGAGTGLHWPLADNSSVLVALINDDMDQPIILGPMATENHVGPVTSNNPWQHILKTPSGQQLLLDDNPQDTKVLLATSPQHYLALDENTGVRLVNEAGNLTVQAKEKLLVSAKDFVQDAGESHSVEVYDGINVNATENINYQCGESFYGLSKKSMTFSAEKSYFNANKKIYVHSDKDLTISLQGTCDIKVDSGKINLAAEQSITMHGTLTIKHPLASIIIDTLGNITINSAHVILSGGVVNLQI